MSSLEKVCRAGGAGTARASALTQVLEMVGQPGQILCGWSGAPPVLAGSSPLLRL